MSVLRALLITSIAATASWQAAPAQAGFFEDLFGLSTPRYAPSPGGALTVTVRPRREGSARRSARRAGAPISRLAGSRPGRAAVAAAPKVRAFTRVDPIRNEKWYLEDKTLRRGDIVILRTGAVMFSGHSTEVHQEADFVPVSRPGTIGGARLRELDMMVTGVWKPVPMQPLRRETGALVTGSIRPSP